MKEHLFVSCLIALFICGCSQKECLETTAMISGGKTFTTSFEENESRVFMDEENKLSWSEKDRISLFGGNTINALYQFNGKTGDKSGTFSLVPTQLSGKEDGLSTNYAIYPYASDIEIGEGEVISVALPEKQSYAVNSFGLASNTMVAVTKDTDDTFLEFKNVCGYLKLQLYGDEVTVKSITLSGNNGERIAGKALVTAAHDKAPTVSMDDDAATSVTLDCGEGVKIGSSVEEATNFWLVIPPTTFSKGFTVTVRNFKNEVFNQTTGKELVIGRNTVMEMKAVKAMMVLDSSDNSSDSIYYCTDMEGFELVAATKNGHSSYLQKDETFAFKCMYDFCNTRNLVAYCDSTGMVERIVADEKVLNVLYHEDMSKMDIFFEKDGKLEWLRDLENPYKDMSSRADGRSVPYSAISVQNRMSYAVYTIINDYMAAWHKDISKLVKGFAIPAFDTQMRTEFIAGMLGEYFDKNYIDKNYRTINTVMNDYAVWVMNELYGDAIPVVHEWVERAKGDSIRIDCHVNCVDSMKTDFRIGMVIEHDNMLVDFPYYMHKCNKNASPEKVHKDCKMFAPGSGNYFEFTSSPLKSGKKYEFRAYLLPSASSKYLSDMKCLLDYRRWGQADEFHLFEPEVTIMPEVNGSVKVKLTTVVDDYNKNFTMGIRYGTDSQISNIDKWEVDKWEKLDYKTKEVEVSSFIDGTDGTITKEFILEGLELDLTYYFRPYIQYSGNISNKPVANLLETIFLEDRVFYGEAKQYKRDPLTEALVQLYKSTNGDNWKRNDNWCSDKPITQWYGIQYRDDGGGQLWVTLVNNNLTGTINQSFPSIKEGIILYLNENQLTNLNIAGSIALEELYCHFNQLTSLNVSGCRNLFQLQCAGNQLTSLDISDCTALRILSCSENQFTSLDVSNKTLKTLFCGLNNQLTSLDVSGCTALEELNCDLSQLTSLDVSGCTALKYLDCDWNQLTSLDVSGCTSLLSLICNNNPLTSLDISNCTALTSLHHVLSQLKSLNASGCTALKTLTCHYNQLTSLNVSGCTALVELFCSDNQLTSLDVSSCMSLEILHCENNLISDEDIPAWFSQLKEFRYDIMYEYVYVDNIIVARLRNNGIGWKYRGEPTKGYHRPN